MPAKKAAPARRTGKTAAQEAQAASVEDPLADLREDDDRYPAQETPQGGQDGPGEDPEGDPLRTVLGEALGAASMCWDPVPEGVFQPEQASEVLEDLVEALKPLQSVQATSTDEAVKRWHADTVAMGFLHKGGRCGCRYIAQVILGA